MELIGLFMKRCIHEENVKNEFKYETNDKNNNILIAYLKSI